MFKVSIKYNVMNMLKVMIKALERYQFGLCIVNYKQIHLINLVALWLTFWM